MAKIYVKKSEVEVGLELTAEEMVSCFEFIGSCFTTDHVDLLMKKLSELAGTATDEEVKKDLNKAADDLIKKMEEPSNTDDEYEKERDEAIQKLKDLGCPVKKIEEDVDVYECKTSKVWENKYALVKAWLIDHGIEFEDKLNGAGRIEMHYDLDMIQLAEMIDWLDDHGDEKFDTTIQI